ncbi:MAG: hypothetical protein QGG87_05355, partial [Nitrospinota bacterium]|nr:hypothetical protein [Nitrospinota bacterium]
IICSERSLDTLDLYLSKLTFDLISICIVIPKESLPRISRRLSIDDKTVGNQAAILAERIINKEKIVSKTQYPAGSYTALNLKKIKEFNLRVNENLFLASINIF